MAAIGLTPSGTVVAENIRDLERGLVDFPALIDGREVYLCWQLGETDIAFWHELETGFGSRRPLIELM